MLMTVTDRVGSINKEERTVQVTAARNGLDVVLMWQDADDNAAVADRVRQKPPYDTSSADSCWVRQYLDWCDRVVVVPIEAGSGFVAARVHRVHAI